jgi:hypothetical protein
MALKNPTYYGVPEPVSEVPTETKPDSDVPADNNTDPSTGEEKNPDGSSEVIGDDSGTDVTTPEPYLQKNGIQLLDLSNPAKPQLAKFVEFPEAYIVNLHAIDGLLYVTTEVFERYDDQQDTLVRYFINRFDVSDANNPKLLDEINIPGSFIQKIGEMIYTMETKMSIGTDNLTEVWNTLFALKLKDGKAYLKGSLQIDDSVNQIMAHKNHLYLTTTSWSYWYGPYYAENGTAVEGSSSGSSGSSGSTTSSSQVALAQQEPVQADQPFKMMIIALGSANPEVVAEEKLTQDQYPNFLALEGGVLFGQLGWGTEVNVYDLEKNPDSLTAQGTLEFPLYAYDLSVKDHVVYAPLGYYGVFMSELP